jgi:hypothetical protein
MEKRNLVCCLQTRCFYSEKLFRTTQKQTNTFTQTLLNIFTFREQQNGTEKMEYLAGFN